jgi:hypothetical protein
MLSRLPLPAVRSDWLFALVVVSSSCRHKYVICAMAAKRFGSRVCATTGGQYGPPHDRRTPEARCLARGRGRVHIENRFACACEQRLPPAIRTFSGFG